MQLKWLESGGKEERQRPQWGAQVMEKKNYSVREIETDEEEKKSTREGFFFFFLTSPNDILMGKKKGIMGKGFLEMKDCRKREVSSLKRKEGEAREDDEFHFSRRNAKISQGYCSGREREFIGA